MIEVFLTNYETVTADIQPFENEYMKLSVKENVLYCIYSPFITLSLEVIQVCTSDRIRYTNGQKFPLFTDVRKVKYINREAREYLSMPSTYKEISAEAIYISSRTEKFLWDVFLNINKPSIPTRLFSDERSGIEWLNRFK